MGEPHGGAAMGFSLRLRVPMKMDAGRDECLCYRDLTCDMPLYKPEESGTFFSLQFEEGCAKVHYPISHSVNGAEGHRQARQEVTTLVASMFFS